jgi:CRISPR-associated RAMP protein (TIGR02581 family)
MSDPAADFHRLAERLRIVGRITTRTALHVGSGSDDDRAASDHPVICDGQGFPVIPGSSLKGTVRATLEALIRAAGIDTLQACDPLEERRGGCAVRPAGAQGGATTCCTVCRLFGTRGIASHVRISDACVAERGEIAPIELRDGVALDRDLRTAQAARRYDLEVVPAGTGFELEIFVDNPEPWMLGLLLLGLDQLDRGFASLGGFASRGLGRVAITYHSLERASARGLLAGDPPQRLEGEQLGAALDEWRQALVQRTGETAHVPN